MEQVWHDLGTHLSLSVNLSLNDDAACLLENDVTLLHERLGTVM